MINLFIVNYTIGIEVQLFSQADIDRGVNVTFPIKKNNISIQTKIPNSIIGKQFFLDSEKAKQVLYYLQESILGQCQPHF